MSATAPAVTLEPTPTLYGLIVVLALAAITPLALVGYSMCATHLKPDKSSAVVVPAATTAVATDVQVKARLSSAREAAQRMRLTVSGASAAMGWACVVVGLSPPLLALLGVWPSVCSPVSCGAATPEQYGNPRWGVSWLALMWLFPIGLVLMLLALLPTDRRRTRIASCVVAGVLSFFCIAMFVNGVRSLDGPVFRVLWYSLGVVTLCNLIFFAPVLRCGTRAWPTRRVIARLWLSVRLTLFALGCGLGAVIFNGAVVAGNEYGNKGWAYFHPDGRCGVFLVISCLACAICTTPKARREVRRRLGDLGTRGEARSAATVAALVGGREPSMAMQHALGSFRGLPFGKLVESDLRTNAPDTEGELHGRTVSATLGSVDFFMSHSWHDEPSAKWAALSAHLMRSARGAEGLLWFDRACINQQKIDESLAALPIYLAGCRQLLVLVGDTYTTRLWCVLELFVFLQMGGAAERITVERLPSAGDADSALAQRLAAFDALHAQCFKPDDRQRLLGIIETAFGSFDVFNLAIREIFAKAGAEMGDTVSRNEKAPMHEVSVVSG